MLLNSLYGAGVHRFSRAGRNLADERLHSDDPFRAGGDGANRRRFKAVSDAVHIPVFIQDTLTTPVSAGLIRQIAEESEHVRYAKVESPPQPTQVQAAVAASGGLISIFGGSI